MHVLRFKIMNFEDLPPEAMHYCLRTTIPNYDKAPTICVNKYVTLSDLYH